MGKQSREPIEQNSKERSNLLPLLQKAQETEGFLTPKALKEISRILEMSENEIYSIASFYAGFRFSPSDVTPEKEEPLPYESTPRSGEVRIALRNAGQINPENINDYTAREGYTGLSKAVKMSPEEVIEYIKKSGLRGRGGAGFSTAEKWLSCRNASGAEKYLICHASEGDPVACTDRVLLENDPHAVLEGMIIGAYAAGAAWGLIYVNAGYWLAVSRLKTALKQMEEHQYLGNSILGSAFSFHIEIAERPSALACGEETTLIRALEGKRSMPFTRPPYPSLSGLQGNPTVINNVETLAHVSAIFQKGAEWFASFGNAQSRGTKIFTLSGEVMCPGIIEVPMSLTLRQIIYDIGGGISGGSDFKAVQTGGPTGGWLSDGYLDTFADYEPLTAAGSIIGSGSLRVADRRACAVDLARQNLLFTQSESCGKCVFCREGTIQLADILTDISEGRGKAHDIDLLLKIGEAMKIGAFCAFGKTASNPVLTTIRDFREEYEAHIKEQKCPAKVCKMS